ncbi:four helix bundle protein [Candidatus Azambacteria bacterium]|nr:four helix bundle protein [Candidatus Azambacteria bacterium]
MKLQSFRDLKVWQKAHELVLSIYRMSVKFPPEERYGLVSQMRRAVISVAANIVEGFRRISAKESLRFYDIANASLEEVRYEVQISFDLRYITKEEFLLANEKLEEVSKMLNSWIRSQRKNSQA